jgi:hypothetical protein
MVAVTKSGSILGKLFRSDKSEPANFHYSFAVSDPSRDSLCDAVFSDITGNIETKDGYMVKCPEPELRFEASDGKMKFLFRFSADGEVEMIRWL